MDNKSIDLNVMTSEELFNLAKDKKLEEDAKDIWNRMFMFHVYFMKAGATEKEAFKLAAIAFEEDLRDFKRHVRSEPSYIPTATISMATTANCYTTTNR